MRELRETRQVILTMSIFIAASVIILAFAIVVGLTLRHHSASALKHPAAALQQADPVSGR